MSSQKNNQSWAETIEALAMFDQWTSVHYADVTQGWQLLGNCRPDFDKKKVITAKPHHQECNTTPGQVEDMPIQDLTGPVVVTFNWKQKQEQSAALPISNMAAAFATRSRIFQKYLSSSQSIDRFLLHWWMILEAWELDQDILD